jgi:hypothetical protein
MAPIKFKCTVDGCSFETDEMDQIVVATVLGIHSEANQVVSGASRGRNFESRVKVIVKNLVVTFSNSIL